MPAHLFVLQPGSIAANRRGGGALWARQDHVHGSFRARAV